ncbi:hypothetical protein KHA90_15500 [Flavobacterium psychroterrae]|uniref:Lipoprotein n=1 Tax=Flavobacterium psychroterrae TaxID=2133767 RepID=A0ABS5PDP9_9FLAO|nr:hypothetical protein [Flavobacterium psychroterrae]MBS7232424.1 hypothetical protein [Flavobacterium psychroterrae]
MKNLIYRVNKIAQIVCVSLLTIVMSCGVEEASIEKDSSQYSSNNNMANQVEFGKILAIAVEDVNVRNFIKEEASVQFDNDYDILVALVKNKQVYNGKTFLEILSKYDPENKLDKILEESPLLTIFVPDLQKFSIINWDINKDAIPLVAIRNVNDKKSTIAFYDSKGNKNNVRFDKEPDFPVLVIKENERVVNKDNATAKNAISNVGGKIKSGKVNFEFISESFNPSIENEVKPKGMNARTTIKGEGVDAKVWDAYKFSTLNSNCPTCYHRDYIYYDINQYLGKLEGPLNSTYEEAITAIKFNTVQGIQAATDDWMEGNLELYIYIFFSGSSSSGELDKLLKVVNIPRSSLSTNNVTQEYKFNPPINIVTWNMQKYGDRWKFWVYENDPSGTVSQTISHSTTRGVNYKASASGDLFGLIKLGGEFGGSTTTTNSSSTTVTYTTGSDNLGEAILEWTDPIVTGFKFIPFNGGGGERPVPSTTYEENTGSVLLSIETVKK